LNTFCPGSLQAGLRSPEPELGILPGTRAGAQIKNQKLELSLNFKPGGGAIVIRDVVASYDTTTMDLQTFDVFLA